MLVTIQDKSRITTSPIGELYAIEYSHAGDVEVDICVRLGRRVRVLRTKRGWTQVYFAAHTGLGRIYISDIERGVKEPCLRTLETLAGGFGISLADLVKEL